MARSGILRNPVAETPIAILDFETTGLTPGIDRVVEVSVVRMEPECEPSLVFDTLVNPERRMAATEIHGITDEDVADAPTFGRITEPLVQALSGCVVAAYNVYFDIRFLEYELGQSGVIQTPPHLCLMYLRPMLGIGKRCRLVQACTEHGIPHADQHVSSTDCAASAQLMQFYLETMPRRGVVTFDDLAKLKAYKFTTSFRNPPLEPLSGPNGKSALKPRCGSMLGPPPETPTEAPADAAERAKQGLRVYWDTLRDAVADLEMTDEEVQSLVETKIEFGLTNEQVRALHANVFVSVLSRYADDMRMTNREVSALRRLHECLATAGWAPGH